MKTASALPKTVGMALLFFTLFTIAAPLIYAQSSSTIAQTFKTSSAKDDMVSGALVSTKDNEKVVQLATLGTATRLVGVIDSSPLVSLSDGDTGTEVVLSGTTNVLVSDINGEIKSGDKIAVSPIAGVGMRATSDGQIAGTAQDSFKSTTSRTITDRGGKKHTIHLGYVRAQISIAAYQASGSDFLPPFIQNAANSLAGRPVSIMRILICSSLLLLGFVTAAILAYTSTRSAMTSLGRNPLAAHAIRRGLYQTISMSLVIVGCALLASYLILTV